MATPKATKASKRRAAELLGSGSELLQQKRLTPKRHGKSKVWEYFGFQTDPNNEYVLLNPDKVMCSICDQLLAYSGNTSSQSNHLRSKHPKYYLEFCQKSGIPVPSDLFPRGCGEFQSQMSPVDLLTDAVGERSAVVVPTVDVSPVLVPTVDVSTVGLSLPVATISSQGDDGVAVQSGAKMTVSGDKRQKNGRKLAKYPSVQGSPAMKDGHYAPTGERAKELTQSVAYHLARDMKPIHTVKEAGFVQMLQTFDSQYALPSTKTFSTVIVPQMYKTLLSDTVAPFNAGCSAHALTCEVWAARNNMQHMGVACHSINAAWQLKCYTLENVQCPPSSACVSHKLAELLKKWSINEEELSAVSTDGSREVTEAVQHLGWRHMPCFGEFLNSILGTGLEPAELSSALDRCQRLVEILEKRPDGSGSGSPELILDMPRSKPHQDVKTRLNATLGTLACFVEQQEAISSVLCELDRQELVPSPGEVKTMEELRDVLSPMKEMIEFFSGEHITISGLLPCLMQLERILADRGETARVVAAVKQVMGEKLEAYRQDEVKETLQLCSFLDPRFKSLPFLGAEEIAAVHQKAMQMVAKLAESSGAEDPASPPSTERASRTSTIMSLFGEMYKTTKTSRLNKWDVKASDEVRGYVAEASLDLDDDPLSWWRMNGERFPLLGKMAKRYLCIPATSVPSQRLFSSAGDIFKAKRLCLKPSNIHPLTFLHDNLSE